MSKGIWSQLLALKALTYETGAIHNAQAFQLKAWAKLVFEKAAEAEVRVSVVGKYAVEFHITSGPDMPIPHGQMLEGLNSSIKDLLGDYFTVRVFIDQALIFEDKGKPKKKRNLRQMMKRLIDADKGAAEDE